MDFFIVDDDHGELQMLRELVYSAFSEAVFIGKEGRVFSTWPRASGAIEAEIAADREVILFLDLCLLSSAIMNPVSATRAALDDVRRIRALRPRAIMVAYTKYPDVAHRSGLFNGIIAKHEIIDREEDSDRVRYVRQVVSTAIVAHRGDSESGVATVPFRLRDSLGIRMAQAAFGEHFFAALVAVNAEGWEKTEVSALTSGHSGAHVLQISGLQDGQERSIVVKCARDKRVIEDEIKARGRYLDMLGAFAGHLADLETDCTPLHGFGCHYYRQSPIAGTSLLDLLQKHGWTAAVRSAMAVLTGMEREQYAQKTFKSISVIAAFKLAELDKSRALASLPVLRECGDVMKAHGAWPSSLPSPKKLESEISALVSNWDVLMDREKSLFSVLQHGDLNPGNVIVQKSGQVVLIDLARLKVWPVGYDLCRLGIMLRLRLIDHRQHEDWVLNNIASWCKETFCSVDASSSAHSTMCQPARCCDSAFSLAVRSRPKDERSCLERGYLLGGGFGTSSKCSAMWILPRSRGHGRSLSVGNSRRDFICPDEMSSFRQAQTRHIFSEEF